MAKFKQRIFEALLVDGSPLIVHDNSVVRQMWRLGVGIRRKINRNLRHRGIVVTAFKSLRYVYQFVQRLRRSGVAQFAEDKEFDTKFGVDTAGWVDISYLDIPSTSVEFGFAYQACDPALFHEVMRQLDIRYEQFLFCDFGSGKGRALLLAANYPFAGIIGIEYVEELHRIAVVNIDKWQNNARTTRNIRSVCADVVDFFIPPDQAVYYFYNPFEEAIMRVVIEKIRRSLAEHDRRIYIVYINPVLDNLLSTTHFLRTIIHKPHYAVYTNVHGSVDSIPST